MEDCLDSFLKNRPYYTAILNDHADELDKTICNKILDEAIDRTDLRDQLKPVAVALDRCQSNSATIADSCQSFLELLLRSCPWIKQNNCNETLQKSYPSIPSSS